MMNLLGRFFIKIIFDSNTFCWNWRAAKTTDGYGMFKSIDKQVRAHRFSYELFKGKIIEGLQIDHLCKNKMCCNPEHLEAVTNRENVLRSNNIASINSKKESCKHGHPLDFNNTYIRPDGARTCKKCHSIIKANQYRKRKLLNSYISPYVF